MKPDWTKIAGISLTVLGAIVSVASGVLEDKKMDDKITEKVTEALTNSVKES